MKTKKLFIVFSVLILLVVLLVPVLADDVREYRTGDTYNLPERFTLDREDAIEVPDGATRSATYDYFYPYLNSVQHIIGFSSIDYSRITFAVRNVSNQEYFHPYSSNDFKNLYDSSFTRETYYSYTGTYLIYKYDSSKSYPAIWNNSDCYDSLFNARILNLRIDTNVVTPIAVYYTTNGVDFARCTSSTDFQSIISSGTSSFVYVWNTGVNNSSMYSFFLSISSWVHDNTLLPLDIAERLVTIIFLTVFYLVVIRLPMYFLYMRDKEGRIRGKWVDVFYFCFCVSYMCAPLWIGVFNL